MGDQAQATDRSSSGEGKSIIPEGLKTWGHNFWHKAGKVAGNVADTVTKEGGKVVDGIKHTDTDKLAKDGKQLVQDGAEVYKGHKSTGNKTVDGVIDFAKELNPFSGLTDAAVNMGEKAAKGEKITGQDVGNAVKTGGADLIVPHQLQDLSRLNRLGEKTGISQQVKDAVNKATTDGGQEGKTVTTGKGDAQNGLPNVDIKDTGKKLVDFFKRHLGSDNKNKN